MRVQTLHSRAGLSAAHDVSESSGRTDKFRIQVAHLLETSSDIDFAQHHPNGACDAGQPHAADCTGLGRTPQRGTGTCSAASSRSGVTCDRHRLCYDLCRRGADEVAAARRYIAHADHHWLPRRCQALHLPFASGGLFRGLDLLEEEHSAKNPPGIRSVCCACMRHLIKSPTLPASRKCVPVDRV